MTGSALTAGEQQHHMGLDDTARSRRTPLNGPPDDGESTPGQQRPPLDEADSTPRSEVPSDAVSVHASLRAAVDSGDEPSYFSPQPRRTYSSTITRSTPASSEPSPASSANASTTSVNYIAGTPLGDAARPSLHPLNRPAYERDLSSLSTASNVTVRANHISALHHFASESAVSQHRDGPVYPNQSYAALQFQQYPTPYIPPIQRARSSHPAHFSANSVSSIPSFGASNAHYRDIMESAPRTAGNSPISSPGLFDPSRHMGTSGSREPTDGLYSSPWLHHTHRQAPKESHLADVTHDPVSGRKVVNQYEIIDELGRGVHGKVKLGKDLMSGKYVAIKIVDRYSKRRRLGKNTSHEDKIKREIAILKKARHPNIVSLLEVIDDPAKKKVYIVLEHVELGEVKWRTEGAPEVTLVEWRRFQRESEGIFDDDRAALEDERIIRRAHQKLARQRRREAREAHLRRQTVTGNEPWSFEFGGDSDDDIYSEAGRSSRASNREDRPQSRVQFHEKQAVTAHTDDTMETAFRTTMLAPASQGDQVATTGLEGTMYGAYDTEHVRGRTPSVADSSSSHPDAEHEEVPEHFRYVPLMTIQGAWEAFKDTVLGLEYLHYQNVIHRDIKPANLLVTKEHRIKISDFGVSYLGRQKTDEGFGDQSENEMQEEDEAIELAKTVGTPAFYAPELCRTDFSAETPHIDGGIDVWALGITLYCLIYGRVPFHENNPFALMKAISEEEPYIPRYRLKPVSERANSRPNSHGRNMQPISNARRAPHDLDYEEIDEDLRDLLKCLLVKDPKHRITIHEIKRHPWLLQGLNNYNTWMEETDPDRSSHGRKIEITDDDLEKAVVPVGLVERMRSAAKKATDYVTKSFTRGGSSSRRRAQSSAHDMPPSMSTTSSSSTISQDARRGSIAPNAILDMLGRSRDEHPLSHSVTASPEAKERAKYFESPDSRKASPMQSSETYRPAMADRCHSSVYTIRQADLEPRSTSPLVPSALPGTPTALDTPTGSHLGGLFGGLPRRVVNSMKSKDKLRPPRDHIRKKSFDKSIDRLMVGEQDPHGLPSLALSTASAAGHVDAPDVKEMSPVARSRSPSYSDAHSVDLLDSSSRHSSISSFSSRLAGRWAAANELEVGPTLDIPAGSYKSATSSRSAHTANSHWLSSAHETSDEKFSRAKDEFIRRRVREEKISRERSVSGTQQPGSTHDQTACPPSPDDETFNQRQQELSHHQKVEEYLGTQHAESSENSPVGGQERGLAFCSSEEQFTPMSQSTSNPSIPSVASASSSVPDECAHLDQFASMLPTASADSISHNQFDAPLDDPAGYDGDHALESDEDDSSDDDGGLFMGKKKPALKPRRSNSISNAELARSNTSKGIMSSRRRSVRSGSNGTVKKIPPPGAADTSAITSTEQTPEA